MVISKDFLIRYDERATYTISFDIGCIIKYVFYFLKTEYRYFTYLKIDVVFVKIYSLYIFFFSKNYEFHDVRSNIFCMEWTIALNYTSPSFWIFSPTKPTTGNRSRNIKTYFFVASYIWKIRNKNCLILFFLGITMKCMKFRILVTPFYSGILIARVFEWIKNKH